VDEPLQQPPLVALLRARHDLQSAPRSSNPPSCQR
jgi:hypothetical protein